MVGIEVSPEEILEVVMELRQRKIGGDDQKFMHFLKSLLTSFLESAIHFDV